MATIPEVIVVARATMIPANVLALDASDIETAWPVGTQFVWAIMPEEALGVITNSQLEPQRAVLHCDVPGSTGRIVCAVTLPSGACFEALSDETIQVTTDVPDPWGTIRSVRMILGAPVVPPTG